MEERYHLLMFLTQIRASLSTIVYNFLLVSKGDTSDNYPHIFMNRTCVIGVQKFVIEYKHVGSLGAKGGSVARPY